MSEVRRSLGFAAIDSYAGLVLQIASTVIIARILTPEQTGVFAVAAVFAAVASTFRDFGVAEYLIQETELTDDRIRAALTLNIAASWMMALLLAGTAFVAGRYYADASLTQVMLVQSLNFLLIPFGAVTHAWFRRELDYRPIFVCNLSANVCSFAVSVSLALAGQGPLALAWGSLVGIVVTVVLATLQQPPSFPRWPGRRELARVFHFGKFASGIYIVAQIGKGIPELVIGRIGGMADVGLFSRARGLVELFARLGMRPVLQICLPYFARAERETGSVSDAYLRGVAYVTAVGWPFVGFMALAAYPAIRIVYGEQWLAAVPVAQVLCVAFMVELPGMLSREALLARGEARRASVLQLQLLGLQIVGLAAGVPWGLIGAAAGLLAAAAMGMAITQWQLKGAFGLTLMQTLHACRPSLLLTLVSLTPLATVLVWEVDIARHHVAVGIGGGIISAACWLAGLRLLRHPIWNEVVSVKAQVLRRFVARRTASPPAPPGDDLPR